MQYWPQTYTPRSVGHTVTLSGSAGWLEWFVTRIDVAGFEADALSRDMIR